jgi:hypothetical protein
MILPPHVESALIGPLGPCYSLVKNSVLSLPKFTRTPGRL